MEIIDKITMESLSYTMVEPAASLAECRARDYSYHAPSVALLALNTYDGTHYGRINGIWQTMVFKLSVTQTEQDLAYLVRVLARKLRRAAPNETYIDTSLNYLERKGLAGSPMRNAGVPKNADVLTTTYCVHAADIETPRGIDSDFFAAVTRAEFYAGFHAARTAALTIMGLADRALKRAPELGPLAVNASALVAVDDCDATGTSRGEYLEAIDAILDDLKSVKASIQSFKDNTRGQP